MAHQLSLQISYCGQNAVLWNNVGQHQTRRTVPQSVVSIPSSKTKDIYIHGNLDKIFCYPPDQNQGVLDVIIDIQFNMFNVIELSCD